MPDYDTVIMAPGSSKDLGLDDWSIKEIRALIGDHPLIGRAADLAEFLVPISNPEESQDLHHLILFNGRIPRTQPVPGDQYRWTEMEKSLHLIRAGVNHGLDPTADERHGYSLGKAVFWLPPFDTACVFQGGINLGPRVDLQGVSDFSEVRLPVKWHDGERTDLVVTLAKPGDDPYRLTMRVYNTSREEQPFKLTYWSQGQQVTSDSKSGFGCSNIVVANPIDLYSWIELEGPMTLVLRRQKNQPHFLNIYV